ncbi:MAG: HDOD domain-containing protein [Sterolibacterium sp.]|nr:HDOD domain-containing protein [Sterolibacterium sp.]
MEAWKKHWGASQWAAFFETKKLPVMMRTKQQVNAAVEQRGEQFAAHDLAALLLDDPLFCLQVLREAERVRSSRLGTETTTILHAVMQLGVNNVCRLLLDSSEVDADSAGFAYVEARSALAARLALRWAPGRADMNPQEVALAALLNDTGELLLWLYAPQLAQAALDELHSGRASRSAQAQSQACGFTFKELTMHCAELWNLPGLLRRLLQGSASERALLTRICTDFARHAMSHDETADQALVADLLAVRKLMPNLSFNWLVESIQELDMDRRLLLVAQAESASLQNG